MDGEERIRELEKAVERLIKDQEADKDRFSDHNSKLEDLNIKVDLTKTKLEEAIVYLRAMVNILKWGTRIGTAIVAVVAYIKRFKISQLIDQLSK